MLILSQTTLLLFFLFTSIAFSNTNLIKNNLIFSTVAINIESREVVDSQAKNMDKVDSEDQYDALRFMGTGVVISEPEKNVYYILTNKHVVSMEDDDGVYVPFDFDDYIVFIVPHYSTYDEYDDPEEAGPGRWEIDNLVIFDTLDLAIIKLDLNGTTDWNSGKEVPIEQFPKLVPIQIEQEEELELLDVIYSAGYPVISGNFKLLRDIFITKSEINSIITDFEGWEQLDFYSLVYRLGVQGGMSGGPVLNTKGNLVAVNGLTEAAYSVEEAGYSIALRGLIGFISFDWIQSFFTDDYKYVPRAVKYDYGIHIDDFVFRALMDDEFNNNQKSDFYKYLPKLSIKYLKRLQSHWESGFYFFPSEGSYFDSTNTDHQNSLKKFVNKN